MQLAIGREPFSLAMAIANLVWGFAAVPMGAISDFIRHHYRHFNGAALVDADFSIIEVPLNSPRPRAFQSRSS